MGYNKFREEARLADRKLMQATSWKLTTYGKIVATSQYVAPRTHFPCDKTVELFKVDGRPTEWASMFLSRKGFLPGWIAVQDTFWTLPKQVRAVQVDWQWVNANPNPHPKELKRQCCECGEWKALDSDHWHRDPKGRNGWQTKCKECRNDYYMDWQADRRDRRAA